MMELLAIFVGILIAASMQKKPTPAPAAPKGKLVKRVVKEEYQFKD
ncbi:MAG: hypothetical protein ACRC8A_04315 [Microcoleaceae cyanobacterium]